MCDSCGCGQGEPSILKPGEERTHTHTHDGETHTHSHGDHHTHDHSHDHDHPHDHSEGHSHDHSHDHSRKVEIEQDVLGKNNLLAERNRGFFEAKNILALNLVSSPGSGKTSLLERTIKEIMGYGNKRKGLEVD